MSNNKLDGFKYMEIIDLIETNVNDCLMNINSKEQLDWLDDRIISLDNLGWFESASLEEPKVKFEEKSLEKTQVYATKTTNYLFVRVSGKIVRVIPLVLNMNKMEELLIKTKGWLANLENQK